jgi:hypothetical protein
MKLRKIEEFNKEDSFDELSEEGSSEEESSEESSDGDLHYEYTVGYTYRG